MRILHDWWPTLAGAALILALVGFAQSPPGRSLTRAAGMAAAPERYTEMAFARPSALPVEPARPAARETIEVPFVLHNVEGATRTYAWTVEARTTGPAAVLARGRSTLADGAALDIAPKVVAPCATTRMRVSVRLAAPAQSIGFWRDCPGRGGLSHG